MITLKEYWSNENYKVLLALILSINAIVFIPIIILLPQFILDDFYIFHVIENVNPYPIAININEEFYLFLRPVAYFIMWIGNTLFGTHSIFYKLFHFVFHLVFVAVVYDFLFKIMQWKGFSIKSWKALLILVFLTINPIVLYWIVEINNITELLMILFYAASLRSIFIYIFINHSNKYLLLYALFFILSALSKQIGLHLPLLILVFLYALRSKIGRSVFNKSYNISIILLIFTLAYSLINAFVYSEQVGEIFAVLWKKPFAAVGIIILTLNSLIGNYIYYFFLDKKLIALITALIIIIIAGLYFRKKKYSFKKGTVYSSRFHNNILSKIVASGTR
ncbi:MAG: glycosyltransferase family 39 protein [Bacteroidetes bacterium]|nr:glycosyltransferase family 39 protein [Bacteroidota bacterium]